jgi:hypothetical protein
MNTVFGGFAVLHLRMFKLFTVDMVFLGVYALESLTPHISTNRGRGLGYAGSTP